MLSALVDLVTRMWGCTCAWCHPISENRHVSRGSRRLTAGCRDDGVLPALRAASIVQGDWTLLATQWSPIQQQANRCLLICVPRWRD